MPTQLLTMNGYDEKQHLNEDDFGAKGGIVAAFDAFRTLLSPLGWRRVNLLTAP